MKKIACFLLVSISFIHSIVGAENGNKHLQTHQKPTAIYLAEGIVLHEDTAAPIVDAEVCVTNNIDTDTFKIKTNADGKFELLLQPNRTYAIEVKHDRFLANYLSQVTVDYRKIYPLKIFLKEIYLGKALLIEKVNFEVNDTTFTRKTYPALEKFYQTLSGNTHIIVEIAVHTDSRGNDDYNLQLSQQRATYIVQYLIEKGIATQRLHAKGYGETHLVNGCRNGVRCSGSDHELNRRVEFIVIQFMK